MKRARDSFAPAAAEVQQPAAAEVEIHNPYEPGQKHEGIMKNYHAPNQSVVFVSSSRLNATQSRQLLRSIARQEADILQQAASARTTFINTRYEAAMQLDNARQFAAAAVEQLGVADALNAGDEAGSALRDWGITGPATAPATADAPSAGLDSSSPADGPTVISAAESPYHGRPRKGYTSGALYLNGEYEVGFPPKQRDGWRYPFATEGGAGSSLDPRMLLEARESLKRPSFPDRGYPMGDASTRIGAGSSYQRHVALAAEYDDAVAMESRMRGMQERAVRSMAGPAAGT